MKNLLLYDGECGLCQAVVRFLRRRDARAVLCFATLQGPIGQDFLRREGMDTKEFDSLVFIEELDTTAGRTGRYCLRTDAVLEILHRLGGGWRIFRVLRLIPAPLRDLLYRLVARLRHRIFGRAGGTGGTGRPNGTDGTHGTRKEAGDGEMGREPPEDKR